MKESLRKRIQNGNSTGDIHEAEKQRYTRMIRFVTYLPLCIDPWTAVPDWKTTSVPAFTGRASPNCDTASSVISMSLPASPA